MAIHDRKQRAWRQREELILDEADGLLRTGGYLGLNLDHVAERIEYSKATIYNHFPSKEDLILAVCLRHLEQRREFFSRALTFDGNTRERMFVVGMADRVLAELHPHAFSTMQLAQSPSIWEKTSLEARKKLGVSLREIMRTAREVVRQGRASGDLPANSPSDSQILFGLVTLSKGAHLLDSGPSGIEEMFNLSDFESFKPLEALCTNYHLFLDGVGWRPLSVEWDYEASRDRILTTLFPEEMKEASGHTGDRN